MILHDPTTREEWLSYRAAGIGASEAGTVLGLNPYQNARALWELKTGRRAAPDLSGNAAVQFGVAAEAHIRALYQLMHPEQTVTHHPYRMYAPADRPWQYATLDGEIDKCGIWECKTATPRDWSVWNDRIPDTYYAQVCHQLAACEWAEFVTLTAWLMGGDRVSVREYTIERAAVQADIELLTAKEAAFWERHVLADVPPPDTLPEI